MTRNDLIIKVAKAIHQAIPGREASLVEYTPFCVMLAMTALEVIEEDQNDQDNRNLDVTMYIGRG